MMLNNVSLIGDLLDDPQVTQQAGGPPLTTFSMETGDTAADVHVIVARGTVGEVAQKYLKVGSHAYVSGRLSYGVASPARSLCCNAPMIGGVQCETCGSHGDAQREVQVVAENLILLGRPTPAKAPQP